MKESKHSNSRGNTQTLEESDLTNKVIIGLDMVHPKLSSQRKLKVRKAIILAQIANINILPATSILVIVNYIGKYYSKEEKKLTSYQELL